MIRDARVLQLEFVPRDIVHRITEVNRFGHADGLDITIDTDERRVTIDVADEVVARLHDFEDGSPSDDVETGTAGREDWTDSTPTDAGESLFGGDRNDE